MRRAVAIVGGGLLIVIGIVLLAAQYWNVSINADSWIAIAGLLVMGVALLAYYADSRIAGALISGCVLCGLGLGVAIAVLFEAIAALGVLGGLGLGFLAIDIVDRAVTGRRQAWALIPGSILVGLGVVVSASEVAPSTFESLIVIGGIGLALALAGLTTRRYGLLTPGGLLLGIAVGVSAVENLALEGLPGAGIILASIGLGFLLVYLLDFAFLRGGRAWPVWPAAFLIVGGAVLYFAGAGGVGAQAKDILGIAWAVLLIATGLWVVVSRLARRRG